MEYFPTFPDQDNDYQNPELHECQLNAAQELEDEVIKLKIEQFGLATFAYDNNMIQLYNHFNSAGLLLEFSKLVKPPVILMKVWSQVKNC